MIFCRLRLDKVPGVEGRSSGEMIAVLYKLCRCLRLATADFQFTTRLFWERSGVLGNGQP
jgi:hypothetical protein